MSWEIQNDTTRNSQVLCDNHNFNKKKTLQIKKQNIKTENTGQTKQIKKYAQLQNKMRIDDRRTPVKSLMEETVKACKTNAMI